MFFSRCRTLKKISPFFLWSTILAQRCCQCHDVDFHGFRGNLCKTQETYVDGPPVDQDGPRIALATNLLISYPIVFFWSLYIYIFIFIYIYPSPNCLDICLCNPSTLDTASRVRWASMYRKREMRTGNVTDKHWQTSCVVFIVRISARPMRCPSAVSDWACRWGALASPWVVVVEGNYPNSSWMLKTSSAICMEPCILFDQSWFHVRRNDFQLWPNTFAASICELWAVRQNGCEPWRSQQCLLGMSWWRCHWS